MQLLTKEQFVQKKSSDTIVVLGSGYSIRSVTSEDWSNIGRVDSIGFNWFCMHNFEPKFYLIREQANLPQRIGGDETPDSFIRRMNRYKHTTGILLDVTGHSPNAHSYNDDRLKMPCVVLRDNNKARNTKQVIRHLRKDPFEIGVVHGKCTLTSVMHMVCFMGYTRVIFVGIDLYDSRYFWLDRRETRHTVRKKGKRFSSIHAVSQKVLGLVARLKDSPLQMFTANPKSLLRKYIPAISLSEIPSRFPPIRGGDRSSHTGV